MRDTIILRFRFTHLCVLAGLGLVVPSNLNAQSTPNERFAVRQNAVIANPDTARILLLRPDISVYEQAAGGIDIPDAAGTNKARGAFIAGLTAALQERGMTLAPMPELKDGNIQLLADYRSMIKLLVDTAMKHQLFPGDTLPTKPKAFDWTVGPGIARLGELLGGDYALFVYSADSYSSRGRNALLTIGVMGNTQDDASKHVGYAGLVDLRDGNLLWLYANVQMTGDIRTEKGARLRTLKMLTGFLVQEQRRNMAKDK